MNTPNKKDPLDEALRIVWLESVESFDEETTQKQLRTILSGNYIATMQPTKRNELMDKLYKTAQSATLGQLISEKLGAAMLSEEELARQSQLPLKIFIELKNDAIFPNNIPIMLLSNLLKRLNVSYKVAEQAILKTFDIMKNREVMSSYSAKPAFRRSKSISRDSFMTINHKVDGRELFENEEALRKYLLKLEELMK